ncbi:MAG: hypothetical protein ABS79_06070 [Planctomycetes bacterium SCN 63-9]|nr:MAG: hypothetical protein ABS79_06070 [Planctomycetes bacterium SCN 63-9]
MRFWDIKPGFVRFFGISLLIASVIHIPLPQPDFHNVRHHDGPGEVCTYHEHLLRWHPTAKNSADASILHWHWVLPAYDGSGDDLNGLGDDHPRPGFDLVYQAAMGDGLDHDWSNAQWLSADRAVVTLDSATPNVEIPIQNAQNSPNFVIPPPGSDFLRASVVQPAHCALRPVLQRWNC